MKEKTSILKMSKTCRPLSKECKKGSDIFWKHAEETAREVEIMNSYFYSHLHFPDEE
jgi:hypothetical protein